MAAEPPVSDEQAIGLTSRARQPKQQLTQGMAHMRPYVTIPAQPSEHLPSNDEDAYGVPASFQPIRQAASSADESNPEKRHDPFQFGTRYLGEGDDIFTYNAWDHVEVDPQYHAFIASQATFQREHPVSDFDRQRFNDQPAKWWDRFYANNQANFFKDRKWLVQEFPVLGDITRADHGPVTVLEVGAGAGNTAFPLLAMNANPLLRLHACDYSAKAVELMRAQPEYGAQSPAVLRADVWDVAGPAPPPGVTAAGSVDVVLMIFVFSALAPDQWARAVANVHTLLKPGGVVLFRDYGRGDLAQVRFKKNRYLGENFYVRGDGTRVYFFDEQELRDIWTAAIPPDVSPTWHAADDQIEAQGGSGAPDAPDTPAAASPSPVVGFEVLNLAADRRLLVNRQRKLKMYRCWLQARIRKTPGPVSDQLSAATSSPGGDGRGERDLAPG